MHTPRTPLSGPGRASTAFTGRTSVFRRRQSAAPSQAHAGPASARPWLRHLQLSLAALTIGVLFVIGRTASDRLHLGNEGVQPALLTGGTVARREAIDRGRSGVTSDYEAQHLVDSASAARPAHGAAEQAGYASGVSLYSCAAGAPSFSWTLTQTGALRNGDGSACLSYVEGDVAFLLTLVPCDSPLVLAFLFHRKSGQVGASLPAAGAEAIFCLDTGDANTQGAPLLLQPCTAVPESPVRAAGVHIASHLL